MATANIGVRFLIEDGPLLQAIARDRKHIEGEFRAMAVASRQFGQAFGTNIAAGFGAASSHIQRFHTQHKRTSTEIAEAVKRASQATASEARKQAALFVRYERDKGAKVIAEIKRIGMIREAEARAARQAAQRGDAAERQIHLQRMRELSEQSQMLRRVANEKTAVQRGGAGVSAGIQGIGRNTLGELPGSAGVLGVVGAGSGRVA